MSLAKIVPVLGLALSTALVPVASLAGNGHGHDKDRDHRRGHVIYTEAPGCPPGLAKKHNGCLPPGQAKKWHRGERIRGDYILIRDPDRYRLDRRNTYWRSGDYVYRVEPQTGKVLDLIGAVSALLN